MHILLDYFRRQFITQLKQGDFLHDYIKVDGKVLKFKRSGITDGYYGPFFYVAFEEQ